MVKSLRQIKEEIANMSSGIGVRGFGDITGEPKVGNESGNNPHIDRVIQGAIENNSQVSSLISNHTDGLYTFDDPNWWENAKGMLQRKLANIKAKAKSLQEGMEKDHYKAIDDVHENLENRNHAIDEYGYGPLNPNEDSADFWKEKAKLWKTSVDEAKKSRCGNCAAFNKSKEITNRIAQNLGPAGKTITEKADLGFCEMFHFKCAASRTCDAWLVNGPIKEEIGGVMGSAGGTNVGSGYIAGVGQSLEGKPSNWGEPGVSPKYQRKKRRKDDPRLFDIFRRKAQPESNALKEIPIQEAETGVFAGEMTFIVPNNVFERTLNEKREWKHWRTFINETDISPVIREYAYANPDAPIFFENKETGYISCVRYGKKTKGKSGGFRR